MNLKTNEILQWLGALFIIIGHVCNAIGPRLYPYNIVAFTFGTIFFLTWTLRVKNKPQMIVNVVAITTCISGLVNAYIG